MSTKNLVKAKSALENYNLILKVIRKNGIEIGTYAPKPIRGAHLPIETRGSFWSRAEIRPDGEFCAKIIYATTRKDITLELGIEIFQFGAATIFGVKDEFMVFYSARIEENPSWVIHLNEKDRLGSMLMDECVIPVTGKLVRHPNYEEYPLRADHVIPVAEKISAWFSRLPK